MAQGDLKGSLSLTGASVGTSNALTGSVSVAVGDLVFVGFAQQTALTASGTTDNLGNTYSAVNAGTDAGVVTGRAFYSRVTVAGTLTTVTVAATSSTNDFAGIADVYEGPFDTSPLNANPANGSNDLTSPFTCPATGSLNMSHQMVVCCVMHDNNVALTATSPNLKGGEANRANAAVVIGHKLVSSTSTTSPEFTGTNPAANVLITASFRANLLPSLVTDSDSFFTPTVTPGAVDIGPSLYSDADTFFAPTVAATYDITPSLFDDADTFFAPTVSQDAGSQNITPSLFDDTDTFFAPTVTPGAVDIAPSLYTDSDTINAPTVSATYDLTPSLYSDTDQFFAPTVSATVDVSPSLYADTDTFFAPAVSPGAVDITPSIYADADQFFAPTVSGEGGTQALTPSLYIDADSFFAPTVAHQDVTLSPSLYLDDDIFFPPAFTGGSVARLPTRSGTERVNLATDVRQNNATDIRSNTQTERRD